MATTFKIVQRKCGNVTLSEVDICHDQGDSLVIEYAVTQDTGNPTAATAGTLTIAPVKGATAAASASATITDNTTQYTVRYEIAAATMATLAGQYYWQSQETFATEPTVVTKAQGQIHIGEDVA